MFNEQQEQIINLLKKKSRLTLAEITDLLKLNKSSVLFQLDKLFEEKIIKKDQISSKKIYYSLELKENLERYITKQRFTLEQLLIKDSIVGLDAYIKLLETVARGKSDIWGYGNLEKKIIPELIEAIEEYRDKISKDKRKDIFTVTNTPENIELLKDHSRKKLWEPWFIGKIIEPEAMDVNCDIYHWDNKVGVCSFENGGFVVNYYEDPATTKFFKSSLVNLFNQGKVWK